MVWRGGVGMNTWGPDPGNFCKMGERMGGDGIIRSVRDDGLRRKAQRVCRLSHLSRLTSTWVRQL